MTAKKSPKRLNTKQIAAARSARKARSNQSKSRGKQQTLSVKKLVITYAALIIVTAVVALLVATNHYKPSTPNMGTPFKNGQATAVAFTLYYPTRLPQPLHIDPTSVSTDNTAIVTMRITDGVADSITDRSFTISQQALPTAYNIETFNSSLDNKTSVKTGYGQATIGTIDAGQHTLASLVTADKTLLLIQAEKGVSTNDLVEALQHLKPAAKTL